MIHLSSEDIHELARQMAIDLVGLVLLIEEAAFDQTMADRETTDEPELHPILWPTKPHLAAMRKYNPIRVHLCSSACGYGYEPGEDS